MSIEVEFFGSRARFHHVGLAVESIRELLPSAEVFTEPTQGVQLAFISVGGVRVELLQPEGHNSPIAQALRSGTKLLHLCFEVPNLEEALASSRAAGFHSLRPPVLTQALGQRRIAWVYSRQYGLFELLEADDQPAPV